MKKPRSAYVCPELFSKIFYLSLMAVVFITAIFVGPAQAVNYWVSNAGDDANIGTTPATAFKSLQRAANAATVAGDVINVMDGTYSYWDNSALCNAARATAGDNYMAVCMLFYSGITLKAQNRGMAKIIGSNESFGGNVCAGIQIWGGAPFSQGDNITIDGFEIDGRDAAMATRIQDGICLNTSAANNIIQYNTVHNTSRNGISIGKTIGGGGDYDLHGYCNFNNVHHNICYNMGAAIYEYASAGQLVEYNLVRNSSYGFEIYACTANHSQSIYRYNISYSNTYGLNIDYKNEVPSTPDTWVQFCTFANNSNTGFRSGAGYVLLDHSIIANNFLYGISESDNGWWDGCTDINGDYNCVYNNNTDYISNSFPPTGDNIHMFDFYYDINVDPQFLTVGTGVWATSYELRNKYTPARVDTGQGLTSPCVDRGISGEIAPDLKSDLGAHRNSISSTNYIGYPDPPTNMGPPNLVTGGWVNTLDPVIQADYSDPIVPSTIEKVSGDIEVSYEESFASGGNIVNTANSAYVVNPNNISFALTNLPNQANSGEGQYHWRGRTEDNVRTTFGNQSNWAEANLGSIAFGIDVTSPTVVNSAAATAVVNPGTTTVDLTWPITDDAPHTVRGAGTPLTPPPGYTRESGRDHYNVYRSTFTFEGTIHNATEATRIAFLNTYCDFLLSSNIHGMTDNNSTYVLDNPAVDNLEPGGTYYYTICVVDVAGNVSDLMRPMLMVKFPEVAWHKPADAVPGLAGPNYRDPTTPSELNTVNLYVGTVYTGNPADYTITLYWTNTGADPDLTSFHQDLVNSHIYNAANEYYYTTATAIPAHVPGTTVKYMFRVVKNGETYWLLSAPSDGNKVYKSVAPPSDPGRIYFSYNITGVNLIYLHDKPALQPLVSSGGSLDLDHATGTTNLDLTNNGAGVDSYCITNADSVKHYAKVLKLGAGTEVRFYYTVGTHSLTVNTNVDTDPDPENYYIQGVLDHSDAAYDYYYADFPSDIHACGGSENSDYGVVGIRISGKRSAADPWRHDDGNHTYTYYVKKAASCTDPNHLGELDNDVRHEAMKHEWNTETNLPLSTSYFMPNGNVPVDVASMLDLTRLMQPATTDSVPDVFYGEIPDFYLRFAYSDGYAANPSFALVLRGQNWMDATYDSFVDATWNIAVNNGFSTTTVIDDHANNSFTGGFTGNADSGNSFYGHYGFLKVSHTSTPTPIQDLGLMPESAKVDYLLRVKDGAGAGATKYSYNQVPHWTADDATAEANPFAYYILQDDLSRPEATAPGPQNRQGTSVAWADGGGDWSRGGTYIVKIGLRDVSNGTADIYGVSGFQNVIPGRGGIGASGGIDSGILSNPGATGTTDDPVHDTRVYYRFSDVEDTVHAGYPALTNYADHPACEITAEACGDGVGSDKFDGFVSLQPVAGFPGEWSGSFTLGTASTHIYYRVYACNNDYEPQAFKNTSLNTLASVGNVAPSGVHGTTGVDVENAPFNHLATDVAARELDRDHGWVMPTRYGGNISGARMIRIISEADVNGTRKVVVTDVSAEDDQAGNIISHEITNKVPGP
ncbi:MAG: right-handed parallel beta-helix repeat-containing protein [bacterium]|nr:right-handed parallel beta-helix repeat-containing protein [bacterium]MDD5354033.1 right-handed parallel beta-helix repeat-containing protein [bacterium]